MGITNRRRARGGISSELYFLFFIIKTIVLAPVRLVLALLGRRRFSDIIVEPIGEAWAFFWEARLTASLIIANLAMFVIVLISSIFMQNPEMIYRSYLLDGPANLLSLNLLPFFLNWFVHFTLIHLIGNMFFLLIFGRIVERELGAGKMAMVYFGAAITSGLLDNLIHLSDLGYYANGASGAIMGLVAFAMLIRPFALTFAFYVPLPVFLVGWLSLYSTVFGVIKPVEGVADWAHLGGFLIVTVMGPLLGREDKMRLKRGIIMNLAALALAVVIYLLSIGLRN